MTVIDSAKRDIAKRALMMGFRFDMSEIIDVIEDDKIIVFLRSVKATQQIELSDGTLTTEEFNDPLIWLDYPPSNSIRPVTDQERQIITYFTPRPQLHILCPYLIKVILLSATIAPPTAPASAQDCT